MIKIECIAIFSYCLFAYIPIISDPPYHLGSAFFISDKRQDSSNQGIPFMSYSSVDRGQIIQIGQG